MTQNANTTLPSRPRRRLWIRILLSVVLLIVIVIAGAVYYFYQLTNKDVIPLGAPSGELTFQSNRDGTWDILLMDPDGNLRNLTNQNADGDDDYFPSWAFQSDMVNFLTDRSGELGAGQLDPNNESGELRQLSEVEAIQATIGSGRLDWDPQWSPDGSIVYFASLREGLALEVYVMTNNDIDNIVRLTQSSPLTRNWFMTLSPDGTQLVFSSDREGNENIYTMNVDGTNLVQLTDAPGDELKAVWSLDGTQILFINDANVSLIAGSPQYYVMNADGSELHALGEDEVFEGNPVYNADGSQIAYMSNEEGFWNIYVMDADGSNVRRLTENDADYLFPVWRPIPLTTDETEAEATEETEG